MNFDALRRRSRFLRGQYSQTRGKYCVVFDEDLTTILALYVGRRATTTYKRN